MSERRDEDFLSDIREAIRRTVRSIRVRKGQQVAPTSPLDVEGIDLGITTEEITQAIRESRERA